MDSGKPPRVFILPSLDMDYRAESAARYKVQADVRAASVEAAG